MRTGGVVDTSLGFYAVIKVRGAQPAWLESHDALFRSLRAFQTCKNVCIFRNDLYSNLRRR